MRETVRPGVIGLAIGLMCMAAAPTAAKAMEPVSSDKLDSFPDSVAGDAMLVSMEMKKFDGGKKKVADGKFDGDRKKVDGDKKKVADKKFDGDRKKFDGDKKKVADKKFDDDRKKFDDDKKKVADGKFDGDRKKFDDDMRKFDKNRKFGPFGHFVSKTAPHGPPDHKPFGHKVRKKVPLGPPKTPVKKRKNFHNGHHGGDHVNPVPEPATWIMMIAGFWIAAWRLRRVNSGIAGPVPA